MINLKQDSVYYGPNIYSSYPVVVMRFQASETILQNATSLTDKMTDMCSDWFSPRQTSSQDKSVFVANYLIQWSLALLNKAGAFLHAGDAKRIGESVILWLGFHNIQHSIHCLHLATKLFVDIGFEKISAKECLSAVENFTRTSLPICPDFQARILMAAAKANNIPYQRFLENTNLWQFGWGENSTVFCESSSTEDSQIGLQMSMDKSMTKRLFAELGFPVVKHVIVRSENELAEAAGFIKWPLVVKPLARGKSKGVTTDIRDFTELTEAYHFARKYSNKSVMLEKHISGEVYRLTVVRGNLISVAKRERPYIIGDGDSSVGDLVEQYNTKRKKENKGTLPKDNDFYKNLSKQGVGLEDIPGKGTKIILRSIPFQDTGAVISDVTKSVHPDVNLMATTLAQTLGAAVAGIDYMTEDISKSCYGHGCLLEFNLVPLIAHLVGHLGDEALVGKIILGDKPKRIPVDLLIIDKKQHPDFMERLLSDGTYACTNYNRLKVGNSDLIASKNSCFENVHRALKNRSIKALLILIDPDEIVMTGLPIDRVDRIFVQGIHLDEDWHDVLRKHSDQLLHFTSKNEVLSQCMYLAT